MTSHNSCHLPAAKKLALSVKKYPLRIPVENCNGVVIERNATTKKFSSEVNDGKATMETLTSEINDGKAAVEKITGELNVAKATILDMAQTITNLKQSIEKLTSEKSQTNLSHGCNSLGGKNFLGIKIRDIFNWK